MKRWEYAIVAQEDDFHWTFWWQEQQGSGAELKYPIRTFESDLAMLGYMSREGWELVADAQLRDHIPRLIFRRRL